MTLDYYNQHGREFFDRTKDLELTFLYQRFLAHVPPHAHILDAGCGSGRDALAFLERGFQVTAIDGSASLAQLASQHTGLPVRCLSFDQMEFAEEFDAVWTCATLLHVPRAALGPIFRSFIAALKPRGVWYMSFKAGEGDRVVEGGRLFTDFTLDSLARFIEHFEALELLELWQSDDTRPGVSEPWVNAIVKKTGGPPHRTRTLHGDTHHAGDVETGSRPSSRSSPNAST